MRARRSWIAAAAVALAGLGLIAAGCGSDDDAGGEGAGLLPSAIAFDAEAGTITLPLFTGTGPDGGAVDYVVTESSDADDADARGVTHAPRLANALGTDAVQAVTADGDAITFAGGVDFSPERAVTPSADGFPPEAVTPGAVGDARYSPLISADGQVVLNASQVANASGVHDSVVDIDRDAGTVTLRTLDGFFEGSVVHYLRLDASVDVVAALEASTLAPNLDAAPGVGSDAAGSARSAIVPIVNGVLAEGDADRQGLQAAVLGGVSPRNITLSLPGGDDYSPIWDITPAVWSDAAIESGERVLVDSAGRIAELADAGLLVSAGEGPGHAGLGGLRALGAVSNCPTVAITAG